MFELPPPPPSVPRANKPNKNIFSPKNVMSESTNSHRDNMIRGITVGGAVAPIDDRDDSQGDEQDTFKLPPIGKNYQYAGATNSIYKKDKVKIARNIAKGEMDLGDEVIL